MGRDQGRTADILEAVALVVIDVQEAFLRAIEDGGAAATRCAFAVESARALGLRVVFTEQVPEKLGPTLPALRAAAPDARVFAKNTFSALQAEGLLDYLRKSGVYHLLIAGLETSVCVYQTALHAHDSDFDVTVLSDCVTGRRTEDGRVVLQALAGAHCHVLPAETVFYSMLGSSSHPRFPAYTSLVKKYGDPTFDLRAVTVDRLDRPTDLVVQSAPDPAAPQVSDEPAETDTGESSGEPPVSEGELPDASEEGGPSGAGRRPRRRRGGARRRRARERAEGNAEASRVNTGDESGPPEPLPPTTPAAGQGASEAKTTEPEGS